MGREKDVLAELNGSLITTEEVKESVKEMKARKAGGWVGCVGGESVKSGKRQLLSIY